MGMRPSLLHPAPGFERVASTAGGISFSEVRDAFLQLEQRVLGSLPAPERLPVANATRPPELATVSLPQPSPATPETLPGAGLAAHLSESIRRSLTDPELIAALVRRNHERQARGRLAGSAGSASRTRTVFSRVIRAPGSRGPGSGGRT